MTADLEGGADMICIRSIELTNVKNVGHGRIEFRDSPFGTRVTGIYG